MDIKKIYYFVEVVKERSFSRAARNLFISQPMLSKAVRQLEDEFGSQLLERNSKSVRVTDVGKLFYDQSLKVLTAYMELQHLLDDKESLAQGEVTISVPSVILTIFFPPFFSILEKEYPNIRLNLYEAGSYTVYDNVFSGTVDMGVVMMPVPMQDIDAYPILSDQCVLITGPDHPYLFTLVIMLALSLNHWIYTRKEPFIKRQYLRAVTKKLILCDKIEHPEKNTI